MPRETPTDRFWQADPTPPTTPMQALMEARPGAELAVSSMEDAHPLAEVLERLLAELTEVERDIVTMHVAGFSVRDIAETLGMSKSQVHREIPDLMAQVTDLMKNSPEIMEAINGNDD